MNQTHSTAYLYPAIALVVLLGTCAYVLSGCGPEKLKSAWAIDSIRVDGQSGDWDNVPRIVLDKQASFSVCNDSSRLYLFFHVNDSMLANALERRGLNIWFDTQGKKKKQFGISYRAARSPMDSDEHGPRDGDNRMKRNDLPPKDFEPPALNGLAVLNGSARDRIPISDKENGAPSAGFKHEGGGITYEFAILLSSDDAKYVVGAGPGSILSLGIEYGGMDPDKSRSKKGGPGRNDKPGGDDSFGGGPPQGGGMGGGGHGGRGMRGGKHGGAEHKTIAHTEIWLKLTLAEPKSTPVK